MSKKPKSSGELLIELIGIKWSDDYDNDKAIRAARWAMIEDEPDLTEPWLMRCLDRFDESTQYSWRDYRNFVIKPDYEEKITDEFRDNVDSYYEEEPWEDL